MTIAAHHSVEGKAMAENMIVEVGDEIWLETEMSWELVAALGCLRHGCHRGQAGVGRWRRACR